MKLPLTTLRWTTEFGVKCIYHDSSIQHSYPSVIRVKPSSFEKVMLVPDPPTNLESTVMIRFTVLKFDEHELTMNRKTEYDVLHF